MTVQPLAALHDVSVVFGSTTALDSVSLTVGRGHSLALIGPNGAGKTTALNLLAGLVEPTTGRVTRPPNIDLALVDQHHHHHQFMPVSVHEVVMMGRYGHHRLLGRLKPADYAAIDAAMATMEVDSLAAAPFSSLSGGQRQRTRMARALAAQPSLLLLDEPITGLDLASQQRILDVIDDAADHGTAIVISTHHLDEARHCDAVAILAGGLVALGAPDDVLTPANLREAYGDRVLGDHLDHDHDHDLLIIDDHGHGH